MATGTQPFTDGQSEVDYIIARAKQLGLDPQAVLAVAKHEGVSFPAIPGDNNSSFGPWQLHIGGALPANIAQQGATYAQAWANSPVGIDYALTRIAGVAKGLRGAAAIRQIVYNFERPKDPASEYKNSLTTYVGLGGTGSSDGGIAAAIGAGTSGASQIPGEKQVAGVVTAVPDFLGKISSVDFLLRAGEVIGGAALIILGVYLLARQVGLAPSASTPVRAALSAVG